MATCFYNNFVLILILYFLEVLSFSDKEDLFDGFDFKLMSCETTFVSLRFYRVELSVILASNEYNSLNTIFVMQRV
jgi:hypothetical protein